MSSPIPSMSAKQGATDAVKSWHGRSAARAPGAHVNAMTIDVEDYFQVEAFFGIIDREKWDQFDCRAERNVDLILSLLAETDTHATFFTLGWIAKRYPNIVKAIIKNGHEIASHGSDHKRADSQDRSEFFSDITRAKHLLEDIGGVEVKGYRAPSFSISTRNLWALEQIAAAGYQYSSSIYPVTHDNYGIPAAPRFAFHPFERNPFIEVPVTSIRLFGRNWPCGGGGYFRLLPLRLSLAALNHVGKHENEPCVFYFHPWEIDFDQPRITGAGLKSRFRHYLNLRKMQPRLLQLLQIHRWGRMDEIFLNPGGAVTK